MEDRERYGQLLTPDIKLHRQYFREMVKLLGIRILYRSPYPGKSWTTYGEIDSNYNPPILTGCLFDQHPDQKTMKKLGWVSELQDNMSVIHVDYDLPNLQVGSLVIVPSGIDNSQGRLFRIVEISVGIIYPASASCVIVPEYEDTFIPETDYDFERSSFNLLNVEEDN